jgi:class 3 adenylate cyclase
MDFFGGAVNTAARVQSLSHGNDVMVTDAVIADVEAKLTPSTSEFCVADKFDGVARAARTCSCASAHRVGSERLYRCQLASAL